MLPGESVTGRLHLPWGWRRVGVVARRDTRPGERLNIPS